MPEWVDTFEHASVTDANREAFNTHMAKFPTKDDVIVNHMELAKMAGAPFKLPKELDGMEEIARADFTSQVHKMFNIRKAKSIDELKDVNLKDGLAEGSPYDEDLATGFKQFVVDNGLNYSDMPKYSKFFNETMVKVAAANATKLENENIATAEKVEAELIKHPDFGSKEKLLEMTELSTRALKNHVGLTADEVTEAADDLSVSKLAKSAPLSRVLIKLLAPLAATAKVEADGGPAKKTDTKVDPNAGSPSHDAIWGSTPEEKASYKQSQEKTAPV